MKIHMQRPVTDPHAGGSAQMPGVQTLPAAAIKPGAGAFAGGFFVAVGDGTQRHALAQQALACCETVALALGDALLALERAGGSEPGLAPGEGAAPQATAGQMTREMERQEKELHRVLQSAFQQGTAAAHLGVAMKTHIEALLERAAPQAP